MRGRVICVHFPRHLAAARRTFARLIRDPLRRHALKRQVWRDGRTLGTPQRNYVIFEDRSCTGIVLISRYRRGAGTPDRRSALTWRTRDLVVEPIVDNEFALIPVFLGLVRARGQFIAL